MHSLVDMLNHSTSDTRWQDIQENTWQKQQPKILKRTNQNLSNEQKKLQLHSYC